MYVCVYKCAATCLCLGTGAGFVFLSDKQQRTQQNTNTDRQYTFYAGQCDETHALLTAALMPHCLSGLFSEILLTVQFPPSINDRHTLVCACLLANLRTAQSHKTYTTSVRTANTNRRRTFDRSVCARCVRECDKHWHDHVRANKRSAVKSQRITNACVCVSV